MRLFIAVHFDTALLDGVLSHTAALRQLPCAVKWVEPENLHLTLKFVGNVDEAEVPPLTSALQKVAFEPFEVELDGVGAFPSTRRARTVWVGIGRGVEPLKRLQADVETACAGLGMPREERPFSPHLTLGRVREPRPDKALEQALKPLQAVRFGASPVHSFALVQSVLSNKGPTYTVQQSFEAKAL